MFKLSQWPLQRTGREWSPGGVAGCNCKSELTPASWKSMFASLVAFSTCRHTFWPCFFLSRHWEGLKYALFFFKTSNRNLIPTSLSEKEMQMRSAGVPPLLGRTKIQVME